jgi:hypothetical protein
MIRERSQGHCRAFTALEHANVPGQMVSILRQELDSMVRLIYLLEQTDVIYREALITASVNGLKWKHSNNKSNVTDREMVNLSQGLQGWTESVYRFGCAFIHLSRVHDYLARDPFLALPQQERQDLIQHLRDYHQGPTTSTPTFDDIVPYLPRVFEKIASNLESYIRKLEEAQPPDDQGRNAPGYP